MTRSDLFCPYGNIDCGDPGSPYMAQCQRCDAADEIQRLRNLIKLWRNAAEAYERGSLGTGDQLIEEARKETQR